MTLVAENKKKSKRLTKSQKEVVVVNQQAKVEKDRIIELMTDAGTYTLTLDPLIDSYIDTFRIYTVMMKRWEDKGFPPTKKYTNKAGATNESKHPMAQQVEVWADKKLKALEKLGLTNSSLGKKFTGKSKHEEELKKPEEPMNSGLANFQDKWKKVNG